MENDPESEIIRRELDSDVENPATQVVDAVVDIEGGDPSELTPIWGCVDGVLDHLFSDPPAPEAQMEVAFTYEGYRITIEQNGRAAFVEIA